MLRDCVYHHDIITYIMHLTQNVKKKEGKCEGLFILLRLSCSKTRKRRSCLFCIQCEFKILILRCKPNFITILLYANKVIFIGHCKKKRIIQNRVVLCRFPNRF